MTVLTTPNTEAGDEPPLCAEGFSVKAHFLNSYRKALGAVLKCQLIPLRRRTGGMEAFEAFAADEDMRTLGHYLGDPKHKAAGSSTLSVLQLEQPYFLACWS